MTEPMTPQDLTDEERAVYEWQIWVRGFGESGQVKLKNSSVMISRLGGVGGNVAYQLAAAGVGRLVLAHAGNLKPSDLNRQLLMTHDWLGKPRIESVRRRLLELNPRLELICVDANVSEANAPELISQSDLVVDCAPLFAERFAMNAEAFAQGKPIVECSMYSLETQLTTMIPGKTPCLRCIVPEAPKTWKRQFPVFGAVAASVGALAAMEAIKVIAGLGQPLAGRMLVGDLSSMSFRTIELERRSDCAVCGALEARAAK